MKQLLKSAKKSYRVISTVALFCLLFASCRTHKTTTVLPSESAENATGTSPIVTNPIVSDTMDNTSLHPTLSMEEMTVALWQQLDDKKNNVWFSPLGLGLAMRTVAYGAKGDTQEQLRRIITDRRIESSNQIQIADALFVNPSIPLDANYIARCQAIGAEINQLPISAKVINLWANNHTNGKISHVFNDPMPAELKLVIANAVYFYAQWYEPFNEHATREDTFYLSSRARANEPTTLVPMMRKADRFYYKQTDDAQIIELPYQKDNKGNAFAMTLVLPREGLTASELLKKLTAEQLDKWLSLGYKEKVILRMPKLQIQYNRVLTDDLRKMGVTKPFTSKADFSGMSTMPLAINIVKQITYLDMNEKGTEAAAVTVAAMRLGSKPVQDDPIEMTVNRPFLMILHERNTHTPVFVGIIHNPKQ